MEGDVEESAEHNCPTDLGLSVAGIESKRECRRKGANIGEGNGPALGAKRAKSDTGKAQGEGR